MDFIHDTLFNGSALRVLTVVDDYNNARPQSSLAHQVPARHRGGGHCVPDRSRIEISLT
jgi:hypothetical protein